MAQIDPRLQEVVLKKSTFLGNDPPLLPGVSIAGSKSWWNHQGPWRLDSVILGIRFMLLKKKNPQKEWKTKIPNNHGSGKYPIWRLNTSSRTPFSTMIMGKKIGPLKKCCYQSKKFRASKLAFPRFKANRKNNEQTFPPPITF